MSSTQTRIKATEYLIKVDPDKYYLRYYVDGSIRIYERVSNGIGKLIDIIEDEGLVKGLK